jgi:nucleoside 2-deoxyribosyltransferase
VFCHDGYEFNYLVSRATELGLLEGPESYGSSGEQLSLSGWERVREIGISELRGNQAFVAMAFRQDTDEIRDDALLPALTDCGYVPLVMSLLEHNGTIDDRIVREIRRSSLLVADVTHHSHGVYFEAGLAIGLGIPVIWTCKLDDLSGAHFDTRQYNHVVWESVEDLRVKLVTRIRATVRS